MRGNITSILTSIGLPVISLFAAPVVTAKLKGEPLNGLPGIIGYWKGVAAHPFPAWSVFLLIFLLAGVTYGIHLWKKRVPVGDRLTITVMPTPLPTWGFGAYGKLPFVGFHFLAKLAHRSSEPIEIVSAYLEGTKSAGVFMPIIVAADERLLQNVHFAVRPILVKDGKTVTRRAVLVDAFKNKYVTEPITFAPTVIPSNRFVVMGEQQTCHFCQKPVSMEDISEAAVMPAHRACIK